MTQYTDVRDINPWEFLLELPVITNSLFEAIKAIPYTEQPIDC